MLVHFSPRYAGLIGIALIVSCLLFITAPLANAASSNALRIQITDQRGVPVRDAVIEIHPANAKTGNVRFPWRMAMAQRRQQFAPGTLVIAKGSTVVFPNLDKVRHSIYSFSKPARFEIDLYGRDETRTHRFPIAGSVKLGCNIHDDMRGYIRVTDTPFAGKTDRNGYITVPNLPTGAGRLTIWHPQMRSPGNELRQNIRIGAGTQSRQVKVRLR